MLFDVFLRPLQASQGIRDASSLVIAEHDSNAVIPLTYNTISAAKELGGDVTVLIAGKDCTKVRQQQTIFSVSSI